MRRAYTPFVSLFLLFLLCAVAFAQDSLPADVAGPILYFQQQVAPPDPGSAARSAQNFFIFRPEGSPNGRTNMFYVEMTDAGKPVTGAPYTATAVTETTQTLADGNRIVNKTTAFLARDSQGRTRREETMGKIGPWAVNGPHLFFINDPVSNVSYIIDTNNQTAEIMERGKAPLVGSGKRTIISSASTATVEKKIIVSNGPDAGVEQRIISNPATEPAEVKTESLGTQTVEGVMAEGKRTTRIIPAGQIGNERPLEITSEVWFSPDLKMVVLSKRNDPRFGETVYRLSDIKRAEPDHSLFEIPGGYTVSKKPVPPPTLQ